MVKADGGLDPKMCRARGLGAHILAALAAAIVHNLKLAKSDPDTDDAHDDDTNTSPTDATTQSDHNAPTHQADADVPPGLATDNGDENTPRPPP